jgi:hypothetical protein
MHVRRYSDRTPKNANAHAGEAFRGRRKFLTARGDPFDISLLPELKGSCLPSSILVCSAASRRSSHAPPASRVDLCEHKQSRTFNRPHNSLSPPNHPAYTGNFFPTQPSTSLSSSSTIPRPTIRLDTGHQRRVLTFEWGWCCACCCRKDRKFEKLSWSPLPPESPPFLLVIESLLPSSHSSGSHEPPTFRLSQYRPIRDRSGCLLKGSASPPQTPNPYIRRLRVIELPLVQYLHQRPDYKSQPQRSSPALYLCRRTDNL